MRAINLWAVHWNVLKCKRASISAFFVGFNDKDWPKGSVNSSRSWPAAIVCHCRRLQGKHMQAVKRKGHNALAAWLSCQFPANVAWEVVGWVRGADGAKNYLPGCPKHCWCQQIPFQRMPTANTNRKKKYVQLLPKKKSEKEMWKKSKINAQALRNERTPRSPHSVCPADVLFAYLAHN